MRKTTFLIFLVSAGCPASEPAPGAGGGTTNPGKDVGTEPTSDDTANGEGTSSSADITSNSADSTDGDSSESTSTGFRGEACIGADETLVTAFLRVQPAGGEWMAPEGTRGLLTFNCAPVAAAGEGLVDLVCEDDTRKPTEQARFEVVTNLPALAAPLSSILDHAQVSMTFQAVPADFGAAGIGWAFSISSMDGDLLGLAQLGLSAPSPGAASPSPELGWDQELIVRDPDCAARPSLRGHHVLDRSLALEVAADDGPVMVYDTDLRTVTLDGDIFTIVVPNAFIVVETMCLACTSGGNDIIVVPGPVELP